MPAKAWKSMAQYEPDHHFAAQRAHCGIRLILFVPDHGCSEGAADVRDRKDTLSLWKQNSDRQVKAKEWGGHDY